MEDKEKIEQKVASIYKDGTYAEKNPLFGSYNSHLKAAKIVRCMQLNKLDPNSIAEVGCGSGEIIRLISEEYSSARCIGYEPMPEAYDVCSKKAGDRLEFLNHGIGSETIERFDLALCIDVFEHIEDYFGFLRDLNNIADQFIFNIPLDMNAQMVLRRKPLMGVRSDVGHIHFFNRDSALHSLLECGFRIDSYSFLLGAECGYSSAAARMLGIPRKLVSAFSPDLAVNTFGGYSMLVHASKLPAGYDHASELSRIAMIKPTNL